VVWMDWALCCKDASIAVSQSAQKRTFITQKRSNMQQMGCSRAQTTHTHTPFSMSRMMKFLSKISLRMRNAT
jgi:hypothetical protein